MTTALLDVILLRGLELFVATFVGLGVAATMRRPGARAKRPFPSRLDRARS